MAERISLVEQYSNKDVIQQIKLLKDNDKHLIEKVEEAVGMLDGVSNETIVDAEVVQSNGKLTLSMKKVDGSSDSSTTNVPLVKMVSVVPVSNAKGFRVELTTTDGTVYKSQDLVLNVGDLEDIYLMGAVLNHNPDTGALSATLTMSNGSSFTTNTVTVGVPDDAVTETELTQALMNKVDVSTYNQSVSTATQDRNRLDSEITAVERRCTTLETDVSSQKTSISNLNTAVAGKQDKLTAGENITITNGVISATAGGEVDLSGVENRLTDLEKFTAEGSSYTFAPQVVNDMNCHGGYALHVQYTDPASGVTEMLEGLQPLGTIWRSKVIEGVITSTHDSIEVGLPLFGKVNRNKGYAGSYSCGAINTALKEVDASIATKQDKLTAGTGISIVDGVISVNLSNANGVSF